MFRLILRGAFALALTGAVVLGMIAGVDAVTRHTLKTTTQVASFESTSSTPADQRRVIMFLTGAQSSGVILSQDLLPLWRSHGRVMVAEYNRQRFDGDEVVRELVKAIKRVPTKHRQRITIIGASMGGLLGTDLAAELVAREIDAKVDFILTDALHDSADLVAPGSGVAAALYAGPVMNGLPTRMFWRLGFNPPPASELEPGFKPAHLDKLHQLASTYPLSGWTDQVRYIVGHADVRRLPPNVTKAVFLQSDMDTTVKPAAYDKWARLFGGDLKHIAVHSTHIEYLGYPKAWDQAFKEAFTALG